MVSYDEDFDTLFGVSQDTSAFEALFTAAIIASNPMFGTSTPDRIVVSSGSVLVAVEYSVEGPMDALRDAVCYSPEAFNIVYRGRTLVANVAAPELCRSAGSPAPTASPTAGPTVSPTAGPTALPTAGPTALPTAALPIQAPAEEDKDIAGVPVWFFAVFVGFAVLCCVLMVWLWCCRTEQPETTETDTSPPKKGSGRQLTTSPVNVQTVDWDPIGTDPIPIPKPIVTPPKPAPHQVITFDLDSLGAAKTPERAIDRLLQARSRMNATIQSAFEELRTSTTPTKLEDVSVTTSQPVTPTPTAWGPSPSTPPSPKTPATRGKSGVIVKRWIDFLTNHEDADATSK